jgi:hypothetical protein
MEDRFTAMVEQVRAAALGAPGESDRAARERAMKGEGATPELTAFLQRVQQHAYRVTDEEVAALQASGHGDDLLFELILGAALGASLARLEAGLGAMRGGAGAASEGR